MTGPQIRGKLAKPFEVEADELTVALSGMVDRGMVTLEDCCYRLLLTVSEYCAAEVRGLVDQFYGGDAVAFLTDCHAFGSAAS